MTEALVSDSSAARKARGAFFTPESVSGFLADWAIRSPDDQVLEPSCGDGAILASAAHRLAHLGAGCASITAFDVHASSAAEAQSLLDERRQPGTVVVADFLSTCAASTYDAVVGNPPYIRYQGFTGAARQNGLRAALAQGVRLSNLSSSWAPFVLHSAGYLKPDGRIALVLPAELLSANYAAEVRDFLMRRFSSITVVLIGSQVFPGVQTEAVLLLAEGAGGTQSVSFASVDHPDGLTGAQISRVLHPKVGQRWNGALTPEPADTALHELLRAGVVQPLSTWGRLSLGAVTGGNSYFALSPAEVSSLNLAAQDVIPISPPGSRHLRSLAFTPTMHAALGQEGAKTFLFRPEAPSKAALAYIRKGEADGVDQAYKCRVRSPWWLTPLPAPPDLFFTYMNAATPQLAFNGATVHYLNSVHGLYLTSRVDGLGEMLALAALNSATSLSAELTGRSYGGGILKLEPREAARLLVPSEQEVLRHSVQLRSLAPTARTLLQSGQLGTVRTMVDEILFGAELLDLREAHAMLSARRQSRGKSRLKRDAT